MHKLVLILFSIVPRDDVVRESVDLVEVNHFYDENGRLVFDQIIFYDWIYSNYRVVAWRLVKSDSQFPRRLWPRGYSCYWQDGEQTRQVLASSDRETWTQYDPELVEREYFPKELRRELR